MRDDRYKFTLTSGGVDVAILGGPLDIRIEGADFVVTYDDGPGRKFRGRATSLDAAVLLMMSARLCCEESVKAGSAEGYLD